MGEPDRVDALASLGRYGTYQLGLGAGGSVNDSAWYRFDLSHRESDGYVDRMDPSSLNTTGS